MNDNGIDQHFSIHVAEDDEKALATAEACTALGHTASP